MESREASSPHFVIDGRPPVPEWDRYKIGCSGRTRLTSLLDDSQGVSRVGELFTVCGWSRTVRKHGGGDDLFCFVNLSDGSTSKLLQVVVHQKGVSSERFAELLKCGAACSFKFVGVLVKSPAAGQEVELKIDDIQKHSVTIYGMTDALQYPLSGKNVSREKLREVAHLRSRTFLIGCIARIRSSLAMATHRFFQDRGFLYVHTPVITCSDCEGAGELFQVTSGVLPESNKIADIPTKKEKVKRGKPDEKATDSPPASTAGSEQVIDYRSDFFSKKAYLTVSGQLNLETYSCGLCDVYVFGPAFRAENSHTSRHLAEFWMIEPELSFADLYDNMRCAEAYLKYLMEWAMTHNKTDLEWLQSNVEAGLVERLRNIVDNPFARITYTEAIEILQKEPEDKFEEKPFWGMDMGSEHERFLAEVVYKKPVIVYNYPKEFKAFYMKLNDDGKTVRAMDVLVPKIGEVIGGSEREDNLERLDAMITEKKLDISSYWWYRDLRKFGTVPHSGFGLGFERLIMLVTGVDNIRDVIPFPRSPGTADF